MLPEEENISNKSEQSSDLLNTHSEHKKTEGLVLWKRGILLALGLAGLFAIANLVGLMTIGIPESDRAGAINLISYSVLFVAMIAVIFTDIPKFKNFFKGWKPYVFGIIFGIGVIVTDIFYVNFVNLYYPLTTSSNEGKIRSVIDLYPVACIFIFGLIGPLCEELAYRVGLFGLLRKVNKVLAYVVAGLVFGLIHFDFQSNDLISELIFLPTYVMPGIAFSIAYDLFGLPCSWTAHATNNLYAVIGHIILSHIQ